MFRVGVSALIADEHNNFLLVNLESFDEKYFAIPGGGIEPEESAEEAVYREVFEELGIPKTSLSLVNTSNEPVRFLFKNITFARDGKEYEGQERYFYGFRFIGNSTDIQSRKGEVRTYKWVDLESLKYYLLFDNQLEETIEKILEIFPEMVS